VWCGAAAACWPTAKVISALFKQKTLVNYVLAERKIHKKAVGVKQTRWVSLCTPSGTTGKIWCRDVLRSLVTSALAELSQSRVR